jgi:hypothetical protein
MQDLDHPRPVVGQVELLGAPPVDGLQRLPWASPAGVSMKLAVFIRASGPTRYQPVIGPERSLR